MDLLILKVLKSKPQETYVHERKIISTCENKGLIGKMFILKKMVKKSTVSMFSFHMRKNVTDKDTGKLNVRQFLLYSPIFYEDVECKTA